MEFVVCILCGCLTLYVLSACIAVHDVCVVDKVRFVTESDAPTFSVSAYVCVGAGVLNCKYNRVSYVFRCLVVSLFRCICVQYFRVLYFVRGITGDDDISEID